MFLEKLAISIIVTVWFFKADVSSLVEKAKYEIKNRKWKICHLPPPPSLQNAVVIIWSSEAV